MKLSKIIEILEAKTYLACNDCNLEIESACGADLMSDVMAYVKTKEMLLTGLVNPQVVRTAEMMDIKVIIFVRGKIPDDKILKIAEEKNIAIYSTNYHMYIACGKLYSLGLTKGGA